MNFHSSQKSSIEHFKLLSCQALLSNKPLSYNKNMLSAIKGLKICIGLSTAWQQSDKEKCHYLNATFELEVCSPQPFWA